MQTKYVEATTVGAHRGRLAQSQVPFGKLAPSPVQPSLAEQSQGVVKQLCDQLLWSLVANGCSGFVTATYQLEWPRDIKLAEQLATLKVGYIGQGPQVLPCSFSCHAEHLALGSVGKGSYRAKDLIPKTTCTHTQAFGALSNSWWDLAEWDIACDESSISPTYDGDFIYTEASHVLGIWHAHGAHRVDGALTVTCLS